MSYRVRGTGYAVPLPMPFLAVLTETLLSHAPPAEAQVVTFTFRDPGYGPEHGGFHPVEIRLALVSGEAGSSEAVLEYVTDFAYVGHGDMAELAKELDFDFAAGTAFQCYAGTAPLARCRELFALWAENFATYHSLGVYALAVSTDGP